MVFSAVRSGTSRRQPWKGASVYIGVGTIILILLILLVIYLWRGRTV